MPWAASRHLTTMVASPPTELSAITMPLLQCFPGEEHNGFRWLQRVRHSYVDLNDAAQQPRRTTCVGNGRALRRIGVEHHVGARAETGRHGGIQRAGGARR